VDAAQKLEEAAGEGLEVAGRIVGALVADLEEECVQLLQLGPSESLERA